jgi:D-glycero-alpha-D-manno-heptose-7-phosphate kinase
MIVTKTPLRISFFGGGSDIPEYYENNNYGLCVSTTINSYIYLAVNRCVAPHLKVVYSQLELEHDIENIKHDIVREVLKHYGLTTNMEICSFSDMPTKGTGLGSSSTFTVGLMNALYNIKYGKTMDRSVMARQACFIEIKKCKQPIGKQDQYAAAYGGLRQYRFYDEGGIMTQPLANSEELSKQLVCFNTGASRLASSVLAEQVDNLKNNSNVDQTRLLVEMAERSITMLEKDKLNDFGSLLHDAWTVKKKLASNVSNPTIDEMYELGRSAGALGGKVLGAGGGGFMLFYVEDKNRQKLIDTMDNYAQLNFKFDYNGSTVEMQS